MAAPPHPFPQRQPLPPNPYDQFNNTPCHDAYHQCYLNENVAGNDEKLLVYARCLGYLILEAPDSEARDIVVHDILLCEANPAEMNMLAQFYIDHLLGLFRQNKGHTPASSESPSRPSFEMHGASFGAAVDPAPKDHKNAKISALQRDGYRCMVTGYFDIVTFSGMTDAQKQEHNMVPPPSLAFTGFCHIFPPSINWDFKPEEHGHPKTNYSGNVWGIVNGFGSIGVLAELNGHNMHRLSNGLTMTREIHQAFDSLLLWFEEVSNNLNKYTVRTLYPNFPQLPHPLVTLTTTTNLELPNPKYLKLHAAVCRVAHMSGAAGYLDLYDREVEHRGVMACDGSSADLLVSRLHRVLLVA